MSPAAGPGRSRSAGRWAGEAGQRTRGSGRPRIVVVGAGIAGLSAAWHLLSAGPAGPGRPEVLVLEGSDRLGGKLRTSELAGARLDEGAEALLVRRPEAVELAEQVGLGEQLVAPASTAARLLSRGRLVPLPPGQFMGVPGGLAPLARSGLLRPSELARAAADGWLPVHPLTEDVAVGTLVRARLGQAVLDRMVDPLLGGVYAGRADELSLMATLPALAAQLRDGERLMSAVQRLGRAAATRARGGADPRAGRNSPARRPPAGQTFAALPGGLGRLIDALAAAVESAGGQIRRSSTVRGLRRRPAGWELLVGPTRAEQRLVADAVVLAIPAHPASRLLATAVPAAAVDLAGIDYASMAIVAAAWPAAAVRRLPPGSGFLVPAVDGGLVKAVTLSTSKWGFLAGEVPDLVLARMSVGRVREEADLQREDGELAAAAVAEMAPVLGLAGPPIATRVTRWGGGLPQYAVGHLDRVERVRAAVAAAPGLAVCGAAYDGIGMPACIASARRAADSVLAAVSASAPAQVGSTPVMG